MSVSVEPVGPQCLQKVFVVAQVTVTVTVEVSARETGVVVVAGSVRVTVVGVGAH